MASKIYEFKIDKENNTLEYIYMDIQQEFIKNNNIEISALILTPFGGYRTKSFINIDFIYYLLSYLYNYSKYNNFNIFNIICDLEEEEEKSLVIIVSLQPQFYNILKTKDELFKDFDKMIEKIKSVVF